MRIFTKISHLFYNLYFTHFHDSLDVTLRVNTASVEPYDKGLLILGGDLGNFSSCGPFLGDEALVVVDNLHSPGSPHSGKFSRDPGVLPDLKGMSPFASTHRIK